MELWPFVGLAVSQASAALAFKWASESGHYAFSIELVQLCAELLKLLISLCLLVRESRDWLTPGTWAAFFAESGPQNAGLAALYFAGNLLAFYVFRLAPASNITLAKSASAAVAGLLRSAVLPEEALGPSQWRSVALQCLGLFVAQYRECEGVDELSAIAALAIGAGLLQSAVANFWNERVLKRSAHPLAANNAAMYAAGVILSLALVAPQERPLRHAADVRFAALVSSQAFVGLAVSVVLRRCDAVARSMGSACAVALLYAFEVLSGSRAPSLLYVSGCAIVLISSYSYVATSRHRQSLSAASKYDLLLPSAGCSGISEKNSDAVRDLSAPIPQRESGLP